MSGVSITKNISLTPMHLLYLITFVAGSSALPSAADEKFFEIPLIREQKNGGKIGPAAYWGKISVAGEIYRVVFDTGSGHLILPSQNCSDLACTTHKRHAVKKALAADGSPFSDTDEMASIDFGTGDVKGVFTRDIVCLGEGGQCAEDTQFLAATMMADRPFAEYSFDGVFGLGLLGLSASARANPMAQFDGMLFGIGLHDHGGRITFGRWNPKWLGSPLTWSPVHEEEEGYWQVSVDQFSLIVKSSPWIQNVSAVVDSGTSMISVPSHVARAMRRDIEPQFVVADGKCVLEDGRVDIEIRLGCGERLVIEAERLMRKRIGGEGCRLDITSIDVPPPLGPLIILGEPFFRKYYTVFDARTSPPRIGFAHNQHDSDADSIESLLEKSADPWWDSPLII